MQTWLRTSLRRSFPAVLPLLGLLLLLRANESLNRQEMTFGVGLLLVVGVAIWLVGLLPDADLLSPARTLPKLSDPRRLYHWVMLGIACLASIGAYAWASDNTYRTPGVVCWVVAVVAWVLAWWPRGDVNRAVLRRWVDSVREWRPERWSTVIDAQRLVVICVVVVAVGLGAFFRFYELDQTPLDPTSDHAEKLLDVTDVLNGKRPIFFERNTGREPFQFYLSAALFRIFNLPTTFVSLKMGTALIGTLTIPFVFLLARELGGRLAGSVAVLFFAVSAWPVEISRAGLRFPYAPFAAAPALWFLLRWMRTRDRKDALFCGLSIGIGLHGYTPIRVVVPALVLGMVIAFFDPARRALRRQVITDSVLIGVTAGIVFIPLGRYALEHPDMFWSRATSRMTEDSDTSAFAALFDNLSVFARNNLNAALGFNWRGDSTFVNAVSYAPILDQVTGALLMAGMVMIVVQIVRRRDLRALFVLTALPILLLSSTLAIGFPNENPAVNREGPAAPFIFAILALPLVHVYRRLRAVIGARFASVLVVPLVAVLVGVTASQSFDEYFTEFDIQTRRGVANTTEIARAIQGAKSLGVDQDDAYIVDRAYWLDLRNIGIAMEEIDWGFTHNIPLDAQLPLPLPDRPMLLIVKTDDDVRLPEIRRTYPDAIFTEYPTEFPEKSFMTVWIPPGTDPSITAPN